MARKGISFGRPKEERLPRKLTDAVDCVHVTMEFIAKKKVEKPLNLEQINHYLSLHKRAPFIESDFELAIQQGFVELDPNGNYSLTQEGMKLKCYENGYNCPDFQSPNPGERHRSKGRLAKKYLANRRALGLAPVI